MFRAEETSGQVPGAPVERDAIVAARNSAIMVASLLASGGVGFAARLIIPRHLGPAMFGAFQFADYFSGSFFVLSVLGFDTYIRKEVSVRKSHANEFFGGLLALRAIASAIALVAMIAVFTVSGKPLYVRQLLLVFAANQILVILNNSYATLLNAVSSVGRLSVLNVAVKIMWAGMIIAVAAYGGGAVAFAGVLVLSEAVKAVGSTWLVRRELALDFRVNTAATRASLIASLPYLVVSLTGTLYANADVILMSFRTTDVEVGWYGAATSLLGISLFLAPIIHNVFLPTISRAAARSSQDLAVISRRSLQLLVTLMTPGALFGAVAAEFVVHLLFGASFAPAASSVRLLCPVILLVYVSILPALVLTQLNRGWTVTWLSTALLVLNFAMNWFAIPYGQRQWGPGGAGTAASLVWLFCEALNVAIFLYLAADCFFDRRTVMVLAKTGIACVVVVLLRATLPMSGLTLIVEIAIYLAIVIATGAFDVREAVDFTSQLVRSRREPTGSFSGES